MGDPGRTLGRTLESEENWYSNSEYNMCRILCKGEANAY